MRGRGTRSFLDAKFSGWVPNDNYGDNNHNHRSSSASGTGRIRTGRTFETAYLTARGRIIDRLLVLYFPQVLSSSLSSSALSLDNKGGTKTEEMEYDAFVITSPGNDGTDLYDKLSPTIFPMDGVTLSHCPNDTTSVITLACSTLKDAQTSFENNVRRLLMGKDNDEPFAFPLDGRCDHYRVSRGGGVFTNVYVLRYTFLPREICHGYTLLFCEECGGGESVRRSTLVDEVWRTLTDTYNDRGPVGIGALEYDTLRVEAGMPGYGNEMTGDGPKERGKVTRLSEDGGIVNNDNNEDAGAGIYHAKSNPLELHLHSLVDDDKGCYQGQEGVASILKNKRGPPRQLYQIVFYDSENDFGGGGGNDESVGGFDLLSTDNQMLTEFRKLKLGKGKQWKGPLEKVTRQPRPGDDIYVLGSNDTILVGKITSVAEPCGTGDAKTVALALARRPGPILKSIREQDLELPRWWEDVKDSDGGGNDEYDDNRGGIDIIGRGNANEKNGGGSSVMMSPPPLDPLHNLEVVIGGTYTVGRLVSVPGRRCGVKSNRGDDVASLLDYETRGEVVTGGDANGPAYFRYDFQDDTTSRDVAAVTSTVGSARPQTAPEVDVQGSEVDMDNLLAEAEKDFAKATAQAQAASAELKRKEDKMKMLQARAEAAMAARRKRTDV